MATDNYYFADGNGNVTYMLNSSQAMVASYRYDPFGNTISSSGTLASANVYRFSSKEIHANSGMYYYSYRFYDPNLQRWINKDPVTEGGSQVLSKVGGGSSKAEYNLYAFVKNNPVSKRDIRGLIPPMGGAVNLDVNVCPSFGGSDIDIHVCIVASPPGFPRNLCKWLTCDMKSNIALAKACLKGDDADWDTACHSLDQCYKLFW